MLTALALASVLVSDHPDGVVTTARDSAGSVPVDVVAPTTDARPAAAQVAAVTAQDLTTREQIDRWISARSPGAAPFVETVGPRDDRQMHGFVSGAIGTGDFSAVEVGVSLPIGENGRLDMAYSETKNGWGMPGYGYGRGYGRGYGYGAYDYPMDYGYGGPLHSARIRPHQLGSSYGVPGQSRSVSARFTWDADSRRDRRYGVPVFSARD